jgi:sulfoxide reductase catalytic subunit YedY
MLIRRPPALRFSDVTPRSDYLNRRALLAGAIAALAPRTAHAGARLTGYSRSPLSTTEQQTPYQSVTTYNNFYEFGTNKEDPAVHAREFKTNPWTFKIEGEAARPVTLDLDRILKLAPLEERIYRFRCVEGWSMVVPWIGFPLDAVLKLAAPTSKAKYVAFESFYNDRQMPRGRVAGIPLPYVEGLRIDEAANPLAILAVGLYGEVMPNQNGAPVRLIVPWKYGFKSIKSIVRIRFVERMPPTTWNISNPREYGFYSNVNPEVDHPRWSQAKERRLGEFFKRDTLKFNGYGEMVAGLYSGMNLKRDY